MDAKVRQRLMKALGGAEAPGAGGARLPDDAERLWKRVRGLIGMGVIATKCDEEALEVGCWALQLPMRDAKLLPAGKLGRTNLRERVEQAAELLVSVAGREMDEGLLDRVARLLLEVPHRAPMVDEARVLADAVNLDDFGVSGLLLRAIQLGAQGAGLGQVVEADEKREQYGYWEARLKDGFHFEPVRQIARRRLERARQVLKLLREETGGDVP